MGITNSNKELSTAIIPCGGSFQIKLSLTATPDIVSNPTDIVLILDRSTSMAGSALANLKNGAKKFIDIIDEATDSSQDGQIGMGSHIGIVSFSTTATQDTQLITSVADLKSAVDDLSAGGRTNHADAFEKALDLFDPASSNARVMVMFTDGVTTAGPDATPVAAAAKAQGVIIYVIGLSGSGGLDEDALEAWASEPASSYVAITPDDTELEDLFEDLARNIAKPGATDIVVVDTVSNCFRITSVDTPSKGTATLVDSTSVRWNIDQLGVSQSEGATLTFTVHHVGPCTGTVEVNDDITYRDEENNTVTFPSPKITVDCGGDICPEDCPDPVELSIEGCGDAVKIDAGEVDLSSQGRILRLDATVRNVCPGKRVALAIVLTEVDEYGNEHNRGLKTITVPAHSASSCRDITVRCISFVLPDDLNESGCRCSCTERNFRARFIAHYIDTDFECCNCDPVR